MAVGRGGILGINELSLNHNERLQYSIDHNADRASPRVLPKDTSAEQIFAVMGTEPNQVMSEKDRFDWKSRSLTFKMGLDLFNDSIHQLLALKAFIALTVTQRAVVNTDYRAQQLSVAANTITKGLCSRRGADREEHWGTTAPLGCG